MLENSYKIEQVLLEILYTVTNDVMGKNIIELLTILNEFGYNDVDVLILNELLGKEIETNDMGLFIKNKLLMVSISALKELGIGLEHDIRLSTVINILLTLHTINNIEHGLKEPILSILEDNEKNNTEKISVIVSLHSEGQLVETFESIEFVTDIFISSYIHKLRSDYELSEDADVETFEEDFKLMTSIINIDPIMTSTLVVRSLMSGIDISRNMSDHMPLLLSCIEQAEFSIKDFAANVATLLFMCDDTKDDMLGSYIVFIEDNILGEAEISSISEISTLVKNYTYQLSTIEE